MKKNLLFFYLFFTLFFVHQKIHASFFNPSPYSQDYGTQANIARWNPSGSYIAIGGVNSPNDLTMYSWDGTYLTPNTTASFGSGINTIDWSPNEQYLAVGGAYNYNELIVYKWNGSTLTLTTSKHHGTQANAVAWNPTGTILAVGGAWGFNNLALYNWDGSSSLTLTASKSHGTQVNALAWHPSGNKLAVAGNNGTQDLILYNWNGATLTPAAVKDHGTQACTLAWTHTGTWLAVGGNNNTNDVIIYTLSGSTLTLTTSISFGSQANTLSWSFDDKYLTVGGDNSSADLVVYEWNGSTLTKIYNSQTTYGTGVYSAQWSPYSDYLAVAGNNTTNDLTLYTNHGYLNGTKNNIKLSDHYLFTDGGYANGAVNISNGCTVLPTQTLKLALLKPLSNGLDLRNTGILQLEDNLYLDANVTLSSGCYINGQNHTIYLGNNLTIPDNSIIHITGDTIINGNGNNLILGNKSQLYIDSNVTLTLKKLTLKNTFNTQMTPPVKLATHNSKLTLDNVELVSSNDFYFNQGHLFIHNDVAFTGTSQFIYKSGVKSYIASNATFYFDHGTTLNFFPPLSDKNLLSLQDASSSLFLNDCSLQIGPSDLRLAKGRLLLNNNITTVLSPIKTILASTLITTQNFGTNPWTVAWDNANNSFAIGGRDPLDGNQLQIFSFNGTAATKITGASFGTNINTVINSIEWHPSDTYLAVGGRLPDDGNEIQIFSFNGTSLTKITGANYGSNIDYSYGNSIAWSPDGNYLAVGGRLPADGNEIQIFSFNGTSLTKITGADYGSNINTYVSSVAWNSDGSCLAVGGSGPDDGNQIQIYSFNGATLTKITGAAFGTFSDAQVFSVAWNPYKNYIAVGGQNPDDTKQMQIYSFNDATLTKITGTYFGAYVFSVKWSIDGTALAICGAGPSDENELQVFNFDGITLTKITNACHNYGNIGYSISWKPDEKYMAISGYNPAPGHDSVNIYSISSTPGTLENSSQVILGDSALGANYDLNINILNNAHLNTNGLIKYDNVN